jgi:hypothetical protein
MAYPLHSPTRLACWASDKGPRLGFQDSSFKFPTIRGGCILRQALFGPQCPGISQDQVTDHPNKEAVQYIVLVIGPRANEATDESSVKSVEFNGFSGSK